MKGDESCMMEQARMNGVDEQRSSLQPGTEIPMDRYRKRRSHYIKLRLLDNVLKLYYKLSNT